MRYSNLLDSVLYYVFDTFIDLVLGKWSTIELHNDVVHSDTGFFTDQTCHLCRIVIFYSDFSSCSPQYLLEEFVWERFDVWNRWKVGFYPIVFESFHSSENRALC